MASISIEKEVHQPSIEKEKEDQEEEEEEKQASIEKEEHQPQQPSIEKEEHQPSIEKEKEDQEEEEEEQQPTIEKEEQHPSIEKEEEEEEEEEEEKQASIEKEEHQPSIEKEEQKTWEKSPTAQAIPSSTTHPKPTEKRSFFSHIYAALFESDNNNNNNSAGKKNDRGFWMNLICGIRPLHHPQLDNEGEEEEPVTPRPIPLLPPQQQKLDSFHDVPLPPPSPGDWPSVDESMGSRYASAEDLLQVLDAEEQDQDKGVRGSIDVKADEFIARFYEQMRLQRVDSTTDRP